MAFEEKRFVATIALECAHCRTKVDINKISSDPKDATKATTEYCNGCVKFCKCELPHLELAEKCAENPKWTYYDNEGNEYAEVV